MKEKRRIDQLLVERGFFATRKKARAAILAGLVSVDSRPVRKPGENVPVEADITVEAPPRYVSRGGEKLEHALRYFNLDVHGLVCLDVGASTGGFTDCLLQHGAARVYAVDVGYGQLDYRLRSDPRVVVMERVNARDLPDLPEPIDLATVDVSFISLEKVLPAIVRQLRPGARIVALVKPQFQGRRQEVRKGGVVKDPAVHAAIIARFAAWAIQHRLWVLGLTTSPLLGPAGNKEFLLLLGWPGGAFADEAGNGAHAKRRSSSRSQRQ